MTELFEDLQVERDEGVAVRITMRVRDINLVLYPVGKGRRADIGSRSTFAYSGSTRLSKGEYDAVMYQANGIFSDDRRKKKDPSS